MPTLAQLGHPAPSIYGHIFVHCSTYCFFFFLFCFVLFFHFFFLEISLYVITFGGNPPFEFTQVQTLTVSRSQELLKIDVALHYPLFCSQACHSRFAVTRPRRAAPRPLFATSPRGSGPRTYQKTPIQLPSSLGHFTCLPHNFVSLPYCPSLSSPSRSRSLTLLLPTSCYSSSPSAE